MMLGSASRFDFAVMSAAALDGWNYVFFSLELLVNAVFVPVVLLLFYVCATQKNLHIHFRTTLFLVGCGHLILDLQRATVIVARMCCIGLSTPSFMARVQCVGLGISMFGWLLLIAERALACVFVSLYETRQHRCAFPTLLVIIVLGLTALLFGMLFFGLIPHWELVFVGSQTIIVIASVLALTIFLAVNKSLYSKRTHMQLTSRYQIDENVRTGRYLMPVAVNDLLTKVIYVCLLLYSLFFTNATIGRDTSHLSHAYDLLLAYQRIFFALALTVRSEKFDHFLKRTKRSIKAIEDHSQAGHLYFNELSKMWR
ncbi:hypothetical protein Q1695_011973 [Nippostrongylus brasiliensis]|nr:hypothetical protein Q1695_011973 [Nippostrongylus brasiliensis]